MSSRTGGLPRAIQTQKLCGKERSYVGTAALGCPPGGARLSCGRSTKPSPIRLSCDSLGGSMSQIFHIISLAALSLAATAFAQAPQSHPPLRVAIVGLVHGHVHGFLQQYQHSPEIEIVAMVEPDAKLRSAAASRYGFGASQMFADLDEMIA